ncbi:hypothetical protein AA309_27175 [Microvirga vignae]|uniref:Uncharacterized protein n=1 Tax=Microvirga vignae TaxID=1225564 RepID=A0A0H1R4X1_9HYPH|nr:hypothetical protein [Microvirga vignae]KLK90193.1 hypothetical protein AA309_27175 [Microvirga vignae]
MGRFAEVWCHRLPPASKPMRSGERQRPPATGTMLTTCGIIAALLHAPSHGGHENACLRILLPAGVPMPVPLHRLRSLVAEGRLPKGENRDLPDFGGSAHPVL